MADDPITKEAPPAVPLNYPPAANEEFLDDLRREKERRLREELRGDPNGNRVREINNELIRMEELKRRDLPFYTPPDPLKKLGRTVLRGKMHEPDPAIVRAKRKEMEDVAAGKKDLPGDEGVALPLVRGIQGVASGESLLKWIGLEPKLAEDSAKSLRVGTGMAVGAAKGWELSNKFPHPLAKAAVPLGSVIGGGMAYLAGDEVPTEGEVSEMAFYGTGYASLLSQVKNVGFLTRMGIGAAEAAGIGILARESKSVMDEGKLLPFKDQWKVMMLELGIGAAIGPFIKMKDPSSQTFKNYTKRNKEVVNFYGEQIALLRRGLKKPYGSKFNTPQARKEARELLTKYQRDVKIIKGNPDELFTVQDPARTARLLALITAKESWRKHPKKVGTYNTDESFLDSIDYHNSLGDKEAINILKRNLDDPKAAKQLGAADGETYGLQIPVITTKGVSGAKEIAEDVITTLQPSDRAKGKLGALMSFVTGGSAKRLFQGAAHVLEEYARKSGEGESNYGFTLARALKDAVDDGDNLSARLLTAATSKAKKQGYGRLRRGGAALDKKAREEFELYQRLRHSDEGGKLGGETAPVGAGTVKIKEYEALKERVEAALKAGKITKKKAADILHSFNAEVFPGPPTPSGKELGHVPLREGEPAHLIAGTVAENLRIANSREAYRGFSPTGKALVDGFDDASRQVAKEMRRLKVLVVGQDRKTRLARIDKKYFPRRLKEKYEIALLSPKKKNWRGELVHREALEEMSEILGVKDFEALQHRFQDLLEKGKIGDPYQMTGELFSHLERGRTAEGIPSQFLDWSHDLGYTYLQKSGHRLAEISNFGQMYGGAGVKAGKAQSNPKYIFNRANNIDDQGTRTYIDELHKGIFAVRQGPMEWLNRGLTGAMIANPFSALKNLTGIFKTWTVVGNEAMVKATGLQLADEVRDLGYRLRGVDQVSPNTELAKTIGIVNDDIANITQMMDNQQLSSLSRQGTDIVGGLLKIGGFTKTERMVRQHTLHALSLERADFLRLYDKIAARPHSSHDAEDLVRIIRQLEYNPKSDVLRAELRKLTGVGTPSRAESLASAAYGGRKGDKAIRSKQEMKANKKLAEHIRFLAKMNIDMTKISKERFGTVGGKTYHAPITAESAPETMKFFQRGTRELQGGYRYDQLPVFMNKPTAKVVGKFMQWSQQMQNHFDRNVLAEAREGNLKPMFKYLAGMQIAGESMRGVSEFFGRDLDDASLAEIGSVLNKEGIGGAWKMILMRMANNAMVGGQWDLMGSLVGEKALRYAKTGKVDRVGIPLLDQWDLIGDAFTRRFAEGGDDAQFAKDLNRLFSLTNRGLQLATELGLTGSERKEYQTYESASKRMRGMEDRWEAAPYGDGGREKEPKVTPGDIPLPKHHAFKRDLKRALILGHEDRARTLANDHVRETLDTEKNTLQGAFEQALKDIGTAMKGSAPIHTAEEEMPRLIAFLKERDPDFAAQMLTYQMTYMRTLVAAGLMEEDKPVTPQEALRQRERSQSLYINSYADSFHKVRAARGDSPGQILKDLSKILRSTAVAAASKEGYGMEREDKEGIGVGGKEQWPFARAALDTKLGQNYSSKVIARVAAAIAKKKKATALEAVFLDPEFGKISTPEGRAKYIQMQWDAKGLSEDQRRGMMDKLAKMQMDDGKLFPTGRLWREWRLDKATWDNYMWQRLRK